MTLAEAKKTLGDKGMVIRKRDDEYRVNSRGGPESTAYYTDDLTDAVNTGLSMAARAELIAYAEANGDESALDELVHDVAQDECLDDLNQLNDFDDQEDHTSDVENNASDINNGGYDAQIGYLLAQGVTPDEIRAAIDGD
jgi:hypothetical protein